MPPVKPIVGLGALNGSRWARAAAASMSTGMVGQLVLVISGIAVARMLTVHDRGVVALAVAVPVIVVEVGTLGVPRALTLMIARGTGPLAPVRHARLIAVTQAALLSICAAAAMLGISQVQPDIGVAGILAVAYVPFGVAIAYGLAILQGLHRFKAFNAGRLLAGAMYAAFAALLFLGGATSPVVVIAVWLVAYAATAIVVGVVAWRQASRIATRIAPAQDLPTSSAELVQAGLRLLPASLLPLGSMRADQLVAGLALAPASLGLYAVGSALCNLPRFLAQSAGMVAYPMAASGTSGSAVARLVVGSTGIAALCVVALIWLADPLVPWLFGADYTAAVPIARILLVAALLFGIRRMITDALLGFGFAAPGTVAEVAAWIVYVTGAVLAWQTLSAVGFSVLLVLAAATSLGVLLLQVGMSRPWIPSDSQ